MQYYAIKNKKTGRYVAGTNFNRFDGKPIQIYSSLYHPPKLFHGEELAVEIKRRGINLKYFKVEVVEVRKAVL